MTFRMRNINTSKYPTVISKNTNVKSKQVNDELIEKNEQFKVGDDIIIYDKESGLWKIKNHKN